MNPTRFFSAVKGEGLVNWRRFDANTTRFSCKFEASSPSQALTRHFVDRKSQDTQSSGRHINRYQDWTGLRHYSNAENMAKTFRMSDYDCVGFDLDHTLARYRLDNLFPLVYGNMCRFLVDKKGYDARLLEPLSDGHDFLLKGLLLDVVRGNLLKVGKTGTVLRASHGTRAMTDADIVAVYGPTRQWQQAHEFRKTMYELHRKLGKQLRAFKDFFDIPAALVAARIVDLIDDARRKTGDVFPGNFEYDFWKDVPDALIDMYNSEAFALGTGGYFSEIRANTSTYIKPCSDTTKRWLRELRGAGKFTYLVTSSAWDYATLLSEFCLGSDWRDYFDLVVTSARKPSFFTGRRPFLRTGLAGSGSLVGEPVDVVERGDMVAHGNYAEMLTLMAKTVGKDDPRVLYVGDSLTQDVFTPAKYSRVHTVAIVEELEAEGMRGVDVDHSARQFLTSSRWGSFFCDCCPDDAPAGLGRVDTLWASVLLTHSKLAVPSVETLSSLPLHMPLAAFNADDPAEPSGFLPGDPAILHGKVI